MRLKTARPIIYPSAVFLVFTAPVNTTATIELIKLELIGHVLSKELADG
jgi:hypothetical protein